MKLPIFKNTQNELPSENEGIEKNIISYVTFFIILCTSVIGISVCIVKLISMWSDDIAASTFIVEFEEEPLLMYDHAILTESTNSTEKGKSKNTGTETGTNSTTISYSYSNLVAQVPATAYIRIPGTSIQYPVMYSNEDGYYLNHAADGSLNRNGAIYLATGNSPTLTDPINYIFGHNMRSGLMFSSLNNFLDADYLASHPDCYLVTQEGTMHYTLFYAASISPETQIKRYNEAALGTDTYAAYMEELSTMTGYQLDAEDELIALVTCTKANHKKRTVVYGYLN